MSLCVSKWDKASFLCHSLKLNSDIVITTKVLVIVSYTHQISSPYSNFLDYLIIFKIHLFGLFGSAYKRGPYLAYGRRAFKSVLICWQAPPFSLCPLVTCGREQPGGFAGGSPILGLLTGPRLSGSWFPQGVTQALCFSEDTWSLCQLLSIASVSDDFAAVLLLSLARDKNIFLIHLFVALGS